MIWQFAAGVRDSSTSSGLLRITPLLLQGLLFGQWFDRSIAHHQMKWFSTDEPGIANTIFQMRRLDGK